MKALKHIRSTLVLNTRKTVQGFIIVFALMACNIIQAQSISELEYFFGNDPGVGNGTLVTATANSGDLTQMIAIPLTSLQSGFHRLTFRAKDNANIWSLYDSNTFYISEPASSNPIANLAAAEYWFDNDPGHGNGMPLTITGNPSETTEGYTISLAGLLKGFHSIGIRIQDTDGIWSLYDRKAFYISDPDVLIPASNLAAAEYWFDNDPGPGNGMPLIITGNPNETIENFIIPLGSLEAGFHKVGLRIQNLDNTWSLYDMKTFYIINPATTDPVSPLTDAEFLYDAELGFGTGTAVAITPTGNPNEYLVEIPTDLETCGLHNISLSVKNALGNYSLYDITTNTDVFDNVAPTIVVFPNISVELDANGQAAPFTISDVNNGTFDDCELASVVMNPVTANYTCANLGENIITITATDAEAKVSTLDVTVTVVDNISPVAISQNITIQLDANGIASVTANDIDNNSTDNCTIVSNSLDVSNFTCSDLGANTVNLTVTDQNGNSNATAAIVTIEDNINPVAIGQDIIIDLAGNPSISIIASDVDNGSNDNCNTVTLSIDVDTFTAVGGYPVVLTVIDSSGNPDTVNVLVTVTDTLSIEDEELAINSIILYPVPTSHYLNFSTSLLIDTIEIFDINGKKVISINNPDSKIDILNLESGVYFLKFYSDNKSATKLIIKI